MTTERIKLKQLGPIFQKMTARLRTVNYRRVLEAIAPKLRRRQANIFARETSPSGSKWAPLKITTLLRKTRAGLSRKILVATGRLRASLVSPGHPDNISRLRTQGRTTTIFWGTRVPYSIYHQFGTRRLPKREHVVTVDDKIAEEMISDVIKTLLPILRKREV